MMLSFILEMMVFTKDNKIFRYLSFKTSRCILTTKQGQGLALYKH